LRRIPYCAIEPEGRRASVDMDEEMKGIGYRIIESINVSESEGLSIVLNI
jgi:hypothetical protein